MPPAPTPTPAAAAGHSRATAAANPSPRGSNPCRTLNPKVESRGPDNHGRAGDGHASCLDSAAISPQISSSSRCAVSSPTTSPVTVDGFEEDALLARSRFLHRAEVLRRRSRRVKQLYRMYLDHYWALMEEMKLKYREYYWEYGKSPFQEDNEENDISLSNRADSALETGENPSRNNLVGNSFNNRCGVSTCKAKAMAMTRFCHSHILSDPKQKLYKACSFPIKSSPTLIHCRKPVLRSVVPSLCLPHMEKADKYLTRALKREGLNIPSAIKVAPKLQVIIVEFLSHIQNRRRSLKAALDNSEMK